MVKRCRVLNPSIEASYFGEEEEDQSPRVSVLPAASPWPERGPRRFHAVVCVRLDRDTMQRLVALSHRTDTPKGALVRRLIEEAMSGGES